MEAPEEQPAALAKPPGEAAPRPAPKASAWAWVFRIVAVLALLALLFLAGALWLVKQVVDSGRQTVGDIAGAFRPERVVETFIEYTELKARGTEGNILEVATAEATETFTRQTNLRLFDRVMPLGTTVSEVSVPATYRFHIDLSGDWALEAEGGRLTVVAPSLQPSLPVAYDSARMQRKTKSGWARWDGAENLETLERTLTAELGQRAGDSRTVDQVREEARVAVAKFVRSWLLEREHWNPEAFQEIVVVFPDEAENPERSRLHGRPATLSLENGPEIRP